MFILSKDNIYKLEEKVKSDYNISEIILMENAGISLFNFIKTKANNNSKILILAGPGSNGGDGFVLMRHLVSNNYNASLYYPANQNKYAGASETNLNILKSLNIKLYDLSELNNVDNYDIIVDSLFGIGLNKKLDGIYKDIIEKVNSSNALKIAVDISSGLICDSPLVQDTVFNADYTITFSTLKYCQTLYPAKKYSGKVMVHNISIPDNLIKDYNHDIFITKNNIPKLLKREADSHKGSFGKVAIIGGSYEMAGAIKITALSALHSGCGLIYLYHPSNLDRNFISDIPEVMTKSFNYEDYNKVSDFINNNISSYSIGNGMGQDEKIKKFILNIIKNAVKPVVIDGDGINALSLDDLKDIKGKAIITPHIAEFSRLIGKDLKYTQINKLSLAKEFAGKYNIHLVLKSADTIICVPNNKAYILNVGNTALSKGGSGDSLCGLIVSFIAQNYNIKDACILSAYILGKSAEKAVEEHHPVFLSITQIINYYSNILQELDEI